MNTKLTLLLAVGLFAVATMFPQAVENLPSAVKQNFLPAQELQNELPAWVMNKFNQWKSTHNKAYGSVEVELYRMAVYYANYLYIEAENARQSEYQLGENQFMDLTKEEFAAQYLTAVPDYAEEPEEVTSDEYAVNGAKNWQNEGKVGPVLNQGSCGSCWSFSATETVQSFFAIKTGSLPLLSEQQLVDCSSSYGNQGCNGGWPANALKYTRDKGQTTAAAYPYTGRQGTCRIQGGAYKISAVRTSSGCSALVSNINTQPTSVAVDASNWSFYKSGVFSNCAANINHAVLAIGYDSSSNWIIRNSWGTSWGEGGNIVLRSGNTCGVCSNLANVQ